MHVFIFQLGRSMLTFPQLNQKKYEINFFQRELRAAYGLIDCLLNGLQPSEKTALFGDLVSVEYFYAI